MSSFGAHRVPGSELSEFLSAYYLCAKANSPSFSQNSPSLPQNSVSFLLRNSTLEIVFRCRFLPCPHLMLAAQVSHDIFRMCSIISSHVELLIGTLLKGRSCSSHLPSCRRDCRCSIRHPLKTLLPRNPQISINSVQTRQTRCIAKGEAQKSPLLTFSSLNERGFLAFPLFSAIAVVLAPLWQNVLKILRSPGKERKTPKSSLI